MIHLSFRLNAIFFMNITKPLLEGNLYSKDIDGWCVSWESNLTYRHWCYQSHPNNDKSILLVLFNPGSLSTTGNKLSQDKTLRILRKVFLSTGISPFIINLFDYANTDENELYSHWGKRDYKYLIYERLMNYDFIRIVFAYGKIDSSDPHFSDLTSRINLIKDTFRHLKELKIDNCTAHPRRWELERSKERIHNIFCELYKNEISKN